ncbi:MAG TPA: hypothetical protein VFV00_14165, partial [Acidimicrobiales bacterium]|nr:hypothetical protein [Acidimicrobiales bacterium]
MGRAGVSWLTKTRRRVAVVLVGALAVGLLVGAPSRADSGGRAPGHVIVRLNPGVVTIPSLLVASVNGKVDQLLPTINGFSAYI